jgi:hypothetical protein
MQPLNKKEMRLLLEKAFDGKVEFSHCQNESAYIEAINNGNYPDAIFYAFLMYFQGQINKDPETLDILNLVKTTIELLLTKNKKAQNKNLKRKPLPKGPYCSFCGKSKNETQTLIAGPSVFICNECVDICTGLLKSTSVRAKKSLSKRIPKEKNNDKKRKKTAKRSK